MDSATSTKPRRSSAKTFCRCPASKSESCPTFKPGQTSGLGTGQPSFGAGAFAPCRLRRAQTAWGFLRRQDDAAWFLRRIARADTAWIPSRRQGDANRGQILHDSTATIHRGEEQAEYVIQRPKKRLAIMPASPKMTGIFPALFFQFHASPPGEVVGLQGPSATSI